MASIITRPNGSFHWIGKQHRQRIAQQFVLRRQVSLADVLDELAIDVRLDLVSKYS